jgi:hypothetical protein
MIFFCMYLYMIIYPCVTTIPNAEPPQAGSMPMDLEVKYDVLIASGLYFLHFSIAASITLVWKKNKTINELIAKVS